MAILKSTSFVIPKAKAGALFERSRRNSFVLQRATPVPVTAAGTNVPVWTTEVGGGWVNEGARKPVNDAVVGNKEMAVRKWATIVPVTEETVTDQDSFNILAEISESALGTFARAIDTLAVNGAGFAGQSYINQTNKFVELGTTATGAAGGMWTDLNKGLSLLVNDGRRWDGSLWDEITEPIFNGALDSSGRPLFADTQSGETNATNRYGRVLGRPAGFEYKLAAPDVGGGGTVLGWAGDWSRVFYGLVGDVRVDIDNRASVVDAGGNTISAFQENLVFVRVEARVGVLVADPEDFVQFFAPSSAVASS